MTTVYEILLEFDRRSCSASSIFVDDKDFDDTSNENFTAVDTRTDSLEPAYAAALPPSMSFMRSHVAVSPENPQIGRVRKAWQKKLVEAAIQRTKQVRSTDSDDSTRAFIRNLKEKKAHEEACSLYRNMHVSYSAH
eukprot:c12635_g1_i2 orf=73-480(+)